MKKLWNKRKLKKPFRPNNNIFKNKDNKSEDVTCYECMKSGHMKAYYLNLKYQP
ncbi:hypothetical protein TanjilG_32471 [Lupinus angustifolius]|uniref:CCHC-type domain-containing protein n=1 Tax=Lupinus angustifolius TaxID=3871 RepID=A0A1J7IHT8_LUPAN|nr:hypothetical protein TanjilG_32471 [Lupinus angustifolius]